MKGIDMYAEIQRLKKLNYGKRRAARELDVSRDTIAKYWDMTQDKYAELLIESKTRTKLLDPYREYIEAELKKHHEINGSILHDHLMAEFPDFTVSARTTREYLALLREELGLPRMVKIRQYGEVAELPMGFQAQVDMGEKSMKDLHGKSVKVYIFAMVLSHCRKKFVYFQDHKFNAREFVIAHDLAFRYFGGRTTQIAYDQDRVMSVSENAGDLVLTEEFRVYSQYAGFSIHLCRARDPESKGKIEAVIKYVKNNFLTCREYPGISRLCSDGLAWLERTANEKKHDTTKTVPNRVFLEECKHLKPVPALSEPGITTRTAIIRKTNVVHYKQNRYAVPRGTYAPGRNARIEPDEAAGKVSFFDSETNELLATHDIHYGVGKAIGLPKNSERFKNTKHDKLKTEVMQWFDGDDSARAYIARIVEKYPRYIRDQLDIIHKAQVIYSKAEFSRALSYCAQRDLYSAVSLRDTLEYFRKEEPLASLVFVDLPVKYLAVRAEIRPLGVYSELGGGAT